VPIFIRDYYLLQSTQEDIVAVLNLLQDNPICKHLEIETYTWDVLPPQMKLDLLASIAREYEWVLQKLEGRRQKLEGFYAEVGSRGTRGQGDGERGEKRECGGSWRTGDF
jgi:hypothetical protein